MKYTLKQVHYNNLTYFVKELCDDDIYDINNDILVDYFDRDYIKKVLDYYITGDLEFITQDNFKDVFEIFFHYGSDIGLLLCNYDGNFRKEYEKLKYIDYKNENYGVLENDYGKIVKFKRDIYNYGNRETYEKFFDWYIQEINFDLEILNYDNYNIKVCTINNLDDIKKDIKYYKICFHREFNQPIEKNSLPELLTHLTLGYYFNQPIKKDSLPKSLTHLTFGSRFDQPIERDSLPKSLTHLTFGGRFNQSIEKDILPESLTHLTFGSWFNQLIEKDVLPESLTHLIFGCLFKQLIKKDVLPKSLTHLTFGSWFNQPIKKDVLPKSLTHLEFGSQFDQPIEKDILPESLEHLTFGHNFNQPIERGSLPKSLKYLIFGNYGCFNQPIKKDSLPKTLTHLTFGDNFDQPIEKDALPKSLIYIKIQKGLLDESYLNDENLHIEYH
jgi:hypothetical protein